MITIIDYKAGNVRSIQNMFKKIGVKSIISNKIEDVEQSEKLVLPGVGHFDFGMQQLEISGLIPGLSQKVLHEKTPILGICLGVQLFTLGSDEGHTPGLGWLNANTVAFDKKRLQDNYKIPHMGWSTIVYNKDCKLFDNLTNDARFYFVHSFHLSSKGNENVIAEVEYGYKFVAGLEKENIVGVQFHPEKSHKFGMQLLKNYVENY